MVHQQRFARKHARSLARPRTKSIRLCGRRSGNSKGGLLIGFRSAPEAAVFVLVHHGEKLLEEYGLRVRLVAVPLEIGALPIHSPPVYAAVKAMVSCRQWTKCSIKQCGS